MSGGSHGGEGGSEEQSRSRRTSDLTIHPLIDADLADALGRSLGQSAEQVRQAWRRVAA